MEIAIAKFSFELEGDAEELRRELASFTEKLRSKFKVSASHALVDGDDSNAHVVCALVGPDVDHLISKIESIGKFCDTSGFAKLVDEEAWFDNLADIEAEEVESDLDS